MMNRTSKLVSAAALVIAGACTAREPSPRETRAVVTAEPAPPSTRLEIALGEVDLGKDSVSTTMELETLLTMELSADEKVRAKLALSRLAEAAGNKERAISLMEEAVAMESDSEEGLEARLFELTTGRSAREPIELRDTVPVAPIARALVETFDPGPDGQVDLTIVLFGGGNTHLRLGTFALGEAVREHAEARCPTCDRRSTRTRLNTNQFSTWTSLPKALTKLPTALVVFYLDRQTMIPSRYDGYLPVPSAEIGARLAKGQGVVVVKERPGAAPVIVLAAPRRAQLEEVEEQFAKLTEVPKGILTVPVTTELSNKEIRASVRARFGRFHECYTSLLERKKGVEGGLVAHFAVKGDGTIDELKLDIDGGLEEPEFRSCVETTWKSIPFPATGSSGVTTVTYPVQLTSDTH